MRRGQFIHHPQGVRFSCPFSINRAVFAFGRAWAAIKQLARHGARHAQNRSHAAGINEVGRVFDRRPRLAAVLAAMDRGTPTAGLQERLGKAMTRPSLSAVATALAVEELELEATNDVLWDCVAAIDPDGVEEVFDATVVGTHNFVADCIAVHNSIEQDADMVVLLHREDAYEKESPRAGEADFIVAKHRNGPTATITVAFQGHYSRFVDMSSS